MDVRRFQFPGTPDDVAMICNACQFAESPVDVFTCNVFPRQMVEISASKEDMKTFRQMYYAITEFKD